MRQFGGSFVSGIISYFARHNTAANLILVLMIVLGLLAINKIRSQFFPDVVIEKVNVSVKWLGAGPEDIDDAIISLLEAPLLGIDNVEQIISSSTEGNARIYIDFKPGTDMLKAKEDVQTALDSVQDLPETSETPTIKRISWRDRVTDIVISGPIELEQLGILADEFTQKLYRNGISNTQIMGVSAPIIRVSIPSVNLFRYKVLLNQLAATIAAEKVAKEVIGMGMESIDVRVKGPGSGRESAVRSLAAAGLVIMSIKDVTPLPHNGCRPPKRRRV